MKKHLPLLFRWLSRITTSTALTLFVSFQVNAQCPNIDFSDGNFNNWIGRTGTCCLINLPNVGIVNGRHTLMPTPGTDVRTSNNLTFHPPGYNISVKLGNEITGAQAEGLEYDFVVTNNSQLLLYDFAVVLENPVGHSYVQMPRFEIDVIDSLGNIIGCTDKTYVPGDPNVPFLNGSSGWLYTDWAKIGVDLGAYLNQPVKLRARTGDCSLSGHAGYAYFRAECRPLQISVDYCLGDTVALLEAPPGFISYQWEENNIPIPGANSPSYQAVSSQGGNFSVVVTTITNCTIELFTILNPISVTADFIGVPGCDGGVVFTDNSVGINGNVHQWEWDFGDGTIDTVNQNPTHTYPNPGTYTVQLLAYAQGCSRPDTFVTTVVTAPEIHPSFTANTICSLSQPFTNTSTMVPNGNITGCNWDFDGLGTSSNCNPTFTFPTGGTYNVTLYVTDNSGCLDSITQQVFVGPIPTADFTVANDCQGEVFLFTDTSTPFTGETLTGWEWNFGDFSIPVPFQNPGHIYVGHGTYNVQLIVTSSNGCTDTIIQQVTSYPIPVADFDYDPACLGRLTQMNNTSTVANPDNISTYNWTFNPPLPFSNQENPQVEYLLPGTYQVTLIVESNHGCRDTVTLPVNVGAVPDVIFSTADLNGCEDHEAVFNNQSVVSVGIIDSVSWAFGDGGSSNVFNPTYLYTTPGIYPVTLTVSSAGCDSSLTKTAYIEVYAVPEANFSTTSQCLGTQIAFNNESTVLFPAQITSNDWTFVGDNVNYNSTSNGQNPTIVPDEPGSYHGQLIVTTGDGCADTISIPFEVYPLPVASFIFDTECFQKNTLIDQSTGGTGSLSIAWDLDNDGLTDATESPLVYVFPDSSDKLVTLTTTDVNGCVHDTTILVDVKGAPADPEVPNVLVYGSSGYGNDKWDFEVFAQGFNECIDYTLYIYNRWGIKVYEAINERDNPDLTCVGCFRGLSSNGTELSPGTYFWVLNGSAGFIRNGSLTLVHP